MDTYETITYSLYTTTKDLSYKNGTILLIIRKNVFRRGDITKNRRNRS